MLLKSNKNVLNLTKSTFKRPNRHSVRKKFVARCYHIVGNWDDYGQGVFTRPLQEFNLMPTILPGETAHTALAAKRQSPPKQIPPKQN